MVDALGFLANDMIGIIGCGHLGRTLARELINHGFPKERLIVSYGGRASTLESIKREGLLENIAENDEICRRANIIFITVRPQTFKDMRWLPFQRDTLVISCIAGISSTLLKEALGTDVFRIMTNG